MKKISFVILLAVFLQTNGFGQRESSFGAFLATPVGQFSSTDLESGGFAKPGWGIVFDSKTNFDFLPENLSLFIHSTYQWNEMDTEKLSAVFTEALGNKTVVSNSKYSPILATVGPSYDIELAHNLILGLSGSLGIIFNNTKAFTVKVYDDGDNQIANELVNFDNHVAFAYTFGAELEFVIKKDLFSISLYSDYTSANQKVELSFLTADSSNSFQKLQYLNTGIKLILYRM